MSAEKMGKVLEFLKIKYGTMIEERVGKNVDLFEILVTTILSQRTREENTALASERLFSMVSTPEQLMSLETEVLENLITPAGTFRQKARMIKAVSRVLAEKYPNSFPRTREMLMELPGVGPKTADVVLSYGLGKPVIAVDVHVEVCSKRLGLVPENAGYEEIRSKLEGLVPEKDRYLINLGFVHFGRDICRTRNPQCGKCALRTICGFSAKRKERKG